MSIFLFPLFWTIALSAFSLLSLFIVLLAFVTYPCPQVNLQMARQFVWISAYFWSGDLWHLSLGISAVATGTASEQCPSEVVPITDVMMQPLVFILSQDHVLSWGLDKGSTPCGCKADDLVASFAPNWMLWLALRRWHGCVHGSACWDSFRWYEKLRFFIQRLMVRKLHLQVDQFFKVDQALVQVWLMILPKKLTNQRALRAANGCGCWPLSPKSIY